jgi:hypothetical protein
MAGLHMVIPRRLTREEQGILDVATLKALKLLEEENDIDMQDHLDLTITDDDRIRTEELARELGLILPPKATHDD